MAEKKLSAREQAFIVIFEKSFNEDMAMQDIISCAAECENVSVSEKAAALAVGTEKNITEIDSIIESHLRGWSKARISKVALAALRLGVYELNFSKGAPVGVIISESVNLCKTYGSQEDKSFVNGVLGNVARAEK